MESSSLCNWLQSHQVHCFHLMSGPNVRSAHRMFVMHTVACLLLASNMHILLEKSTVFLVLLCALACLSAQSSKYLRSHSCVVKLVWLSVELNNLHEISHNDGKGASINSPSYGIRLFLPAVEFLKCCDWRIVSPSPGNVMPLLACALLCK